MSSYPFKAIDTHTATRTTRTVLPLADIWPLASTNSMLSGLSTGNSDFAMQKNLQEYLEEHLKIPLTSDYTQVSNESNLLSPDATVGSTQVNAIRPNSIESISQSKSIEPESTRPLTWRNSLGRDWLQGLDRIKSLRLNSGLNSTPTERKNVSEMASKVKLNGIKKAMRAAERADAEKKIKEEKRAEEIIASKRKKGAVAKTSKPAAEPSAVVVPGLNDLI